ncbi:terminase large subunit [Vibrio phage D148]
MQVGKSLGLAGRMVTGSISQKYFTSLFMAPSQIQTKRFSSGYLDTFRESKYVNKYFVNHSDPGNVFEKTFSNKSKIYLSYGQTSNDADRVRGLTADMMALDEIQDIQLESIPVIKEILNTSDFGYQLFTGTSKSTANTLEQLWLESNQMEFVHKCKKCGKWVIPNEFNTMMEMVVNPKYMVCPHCHKEFSFVGGHWVATKNELSQGKGAKYGMHLPQLIFGANTRTGSRQWDDLYDKVQQSKNGVLYTAETVSNEIFGLATDLGATSLSMSEARACCFPEILDWPKPDKSNINPAAMPLINGIHTTVLGVDWSVSGSEGSHTVVSVLGIDHSGRMILLYAKKLIGSHILTQVDEVLSIARQYNCKMIGSDRGVGVLQGELMQQKYGHQRVIMCQYVAAAKRLSWNQAGNFLAADRTGAMDDVMHKMRLGPDRFITPSWKVMEGFWGDALGIFEEETVIGKRVYRKQPSIPDDWFHSVVFANLAYKYLTGDFVHLDHYDGQE